MDIGYAMALTIFLTSQINFLFTSVYFHRGMAHRSVKFHLIIGETMRAWLLVFAGQARNKWVGVHRMHHDSPDEPGDPHSPHLEGGPWKLFFTHELRYAKATAHPDLAYFIQDIPNRKIDVILENSTLGLVIGFLLFGTVFGLIYYSWSAFLIGLLTYGIQFIIYLKGGASVNSFCHWFGYRNFKHDLRGHENKATNLVPFGLLIGGEGWHNNHHHNPLSPKLGYRWWEFDPGWILTKILMLFKLAEQIKPTINEKETGKQLPKVPQ